MVMNFYHHYREGFLPGPGGAGNQDYRIMRGIEIISAVINDIENDRREEWRQKLGKQRV